MWNSVLTTWYNTAQGNRTRTGPIRLQPAAPRLSAIRGDDDGGTSAHELLH